MFKFAVEIGAASVALLLTWAAIAKVVAWIQRRHHRLLDLVPGPTRTKSFGLAVVIASEAAIALLLVATPSYGFALAFLLFVAFTTRFRAMVGEKCDCFGGALEFGGTSNALLIRNCGLAILSALGWLAAGVTSPRLGWQAGLGALFVLFVLWAFDQLVDPTPRRAETPTWVTS